MNEITNILENIHATACSMRIMVYCLNNERLKNKWRSKQQGLIQISFVLKGEKMIHFTQNKEVFMTTDVKIWARVLQNLEYEKIAYETKTMNSGTNGRSSETLWGEVGENQTFTSIYHVYVEKKDFFKANYVVEKSVKALIQ